jgi:hypothetical protein
MSVPDAEVTAYIGRWRPSSVSPPAAAFARDVITAAGPEGQERAKNLLWAAGKLAGYAASLGLDLVPGVVLHPSVAERFTRCAPGPVRPRERAKQPYSPAEIGGYLALADAQPTLGRRMRGGAGLPGRRRRADPR